MSSKIPRHVETLQHAKGLGTRDLWTTLRPMFTRQQNPALMHVYDSKSGALQLFYETVTAQSEPLNKANALPPPPPKPRIRPIRVAPVPHAAPSAPVAPPVAPAVVVAPVAPPVAPVPVPAQPSGHS